MTNPTDTSDTSPVSLREILQNFYEYSYMAGARNERGESVREGRKEYTMDEAEQAIHAYIEWLVVQAKPNHTEFQHPDKSKLKEYQFGVKIGISEYEQAIKTVLKGDGQFATPLEALRSQVKVDEENI